MFSSNNPADHSEMSSSAIFSKNNDHNYAASLIGQDGNNNFVQSKEKSNSISSKTDASVIVNKCCEKFEVKIASYCTKVNVSGRLSFFNYK